LPDEIHIPYTGEDDDRSCQQKMKMQEMVYHSFDIAIVLGQHAGKRKFRFLCMLWME
ncbi:hypothetical protein ACJX0J_012762, partial [Zea mays]